MPREFSVRELFYIMHLSTLPFENRFRGLIIYPERIQYQGTCRPLRANVDADDLGLNAQQRWTQVMEAYIGFCGVVMQVCCPRDSLEDPAGKRIVQLDWFEYCVAHFLPQYGRGSTRGNTRFSFSCGDVPRAKKMTLGRIALSLYVNDNKPFISSGCT